jgi:protein-S-isoprenylcysteine O-methyltransferase Ste14
MHVNLLKSILQNIGVVAVGFLFALIGVGTDRLLGIASFQSLFALVLGSALLAAGFLLRVWATYRFYCRQMNVIVLSAQTYLITDGPYRFSRNPLYLGGNVFIFLGASLVLGTLGGIVLTIIHWPLVGLMVRREERQLEAAFGDQWRQHKVRVRRWI